ncbi:hypothetical protein LCGC14_3088260 [marine sediment metagenome]|uniref:Uncharacterized protein n=1 Tax=marine sediment metagenome TaxID=412755 RepID=A0A0F8WBW8_9ZZZZ
MLDKMETEKIINNWITKQGGFFISNITLICPCCKEPRTQVVLTKRSQLCMHCFILQIVRVCEKQKNRGEIKC